MRPASKRGRCEPHYRALLRQEAPPCSVDQCARPSEKRGLCSPHYTRWRMYGDPAVTAECVACSAPVRGNGARFRYCPDCKPIQRAEWYAANRERLSAQHKAYYRRNLESVTATNKRWAEANADRKRQAAKVYMQRADRICAWRGCTDFATPRDVFCRPHKNEDQGRRYRRQRAAKQQELSKIQNGLCPDALHGGCGLPLGPGVHHVDHLIPQSRGGPDEEWNWQLMHGICNGRKKDRIVPAAVALAAARGVTILPRARAA